MLQINPKETTVSELHSYLLGAVGPRPIALASTVNKSGQPNLSPFSFFNIFSANPPIAIFSPARRVRNNTTKHTLENIINNKEVVLNVVTHDIVQQTSLSSTEYAKEVNEFEKAGFTPLNSKIIKPFRVKESPVQLECVVNDIISLGKEGGAGNLVICEIKIIHINEEILNDLGKIDPAKIDLVGRMGGDWYCRAFKDSLFEVEKPLRTLGVGIDQIPMEIRNSDTLSGNDLGILGNIEKIPSIPEVQEFIEKNSDINEIIHFDKQNKNSIKALHLLAKKLLKQGKTIDAWKILLIYKLK